MCIRPILRPMRSRWHVTEFLLGCIGLLGSVCLSILPLYTAFHLSVNWCMHLEKSFCWYLSTFVWVIELNVIYHVIYFSAETVNFRAYFSLWLILLIIWSAEYKRSFQVYILLSYSGASWLTVTIRSQTFMYYAILYLEIF